MADQKGYRKDDRDARKSEDEKEEGPESDASQQAAELQVGEEGERADPSRFEPNKEGAIQPGRNKP